MCVWLPVANKLYQGGRQSHAKLACDWRPVEFKLYPSGRQWHAKIACGWRPVAFKLYLSGCQSHANCTRVAASRRQISVDFIHVAWDWWPVACKAASFLKARCETNYFNLKMRKPLKNLRTYATYVPA